MTVKIEDQFGNLVTSDSSDMVTVGIATGPGSFTGGSTTTVTASGGVATFSNLHLNTAGSYTLSETATGSLTGPSFQQLHGHARPPPTSWSSASSRPTPRPGRPSRPAVTVKIEDQFGNLVTSDSTDTVTVGIASGPGSFTGTQHDHGDGQHRRRHVQQPAPEHRRAATP